jgi:hypothetical protein
LLVELGERSLERGRSTRLRLQRPQAALRSLETRQHVVSVAHGVRSRALDSSRGSAEASIIGLCRGIDGPERARRRTQRLDDVLMARIRGPLERIDRCREST